MKISCLKERLEEVISKAEKIASKHPTLPILDCLYLEVKGKTLYIRATNLEIGALFEVPVSAEEEGVCAVNASILYRTISNLPEQEKINITLEGNILRIYSEKIDTKINTTPHDDFPNIPQAKEGFELAIQAKSLIDGFKSVWYSSAINSIKPELSSVYVYGDNDYLTFVATDVFRLAEKKVKLSKVGEVPSFLVPYKNASEIVRLCEGGDEEREIKLAIEQNQITIFDKSSYFTSRLVGGNFPDYAQIIPKEFTTECVVLKKDILNSLKISTVFSDKFSQVVFAVDKETTPRLVIETKNTEIGNVKTVVDVAITGGSIKLHFNYRYIVDILQSVKTDSISIGFSGENKPMVIRPVGDQTFMALVMPMYV